ncbi:hypothetical protein ACN20G_19120 [Streptomyces sp. BI20]|uniref:hypothetical protein n=1 Tax=Streptomyces sp. BI20 TaxID=3403460 RepID=UPI003C77C3DB
MALLKKRQVGKPGEWYYCLKHKKVEEGPECPAKDRFGPYTSREDANHAMERARERNLQWENDPRWHGKTTDAPTAEDGDGAGAAGTTDTGTATPTD